MKILIIGDQHFRLQLPYSAAFEDGRRSEWEAVKERIHENAKSCDVVVLLGDNLNTRNNHSSVNREFVEFLKGFGDKSIHVIAGNHERFGAETAIDFLERLHYPKWHIHTGVPEMNYLFSDTLSATFLPFVTPGVLGVESIEEANQKIVDALPEADILFHHHVPKGALIFGNELSEQMNEIVLNTDLLEKKFKWIIGGHIHAPQQVSDQTYVTGSIFTHEIGEHYKNVWILDTNAKTMTPVDLPVRGIYAATWKGDEHSMAHIPNGSIVKCTVTDRSVDIDVVKKALQRFDASVIVTQYPNERTKVNVENSGALDLSVDNLLKVYAEAKDVSYQDLRDAMAMLDNA